MAADGPGASYRELFEVSDDALLICDASGVCVHANARALELARASREALAGRRLVDLLEAHGLKAVTRQTLSNGEVLVVLRDRVRLSAQQFEFMLEHSSEEVYVVRRDGSFAYVNQAAARSLGYSRDELLALDVTALDPDYGPRFAAHLDSLKDTLAAPFETTHRTKDGRALNKEVSAAHLVLEGVDVVCAFVRDVTARKRAEAELRQVTRLFALRSQINHSVVEVRDRVALFEAVCRAAVDFGFHMTWVGALSPEGLVLPVAQAGHVDGYLDGLVVDTRDERLSRGPTGVAVREGRLDVCADIAAEARMRPWFERALSRGYLASAAVPLRTRGKVVGALNLYASEPGFFSERECQLLREVGEELSYALDALDSRAERELLRGQLDQARKLESVGRLAGGVAHDFNNLLTVILSGVDYALHLVGKGHPAVSALEESRDAARRSAELTSQLLAFARLQPRTPRVLDLNATIDGSLMLLRRLLGEGVTLAWHPAPGLWPIRADASQVDQLLTNLCVNARDSLGPGGTITLSTGNVTLDEAAAKPLTLAPGAYVSLLVADDGAGMTPDVLGRVFEPFFTTKPPGKGTGLGLATVYGIVKQNGGHITVSSAPGQGSTFTLYLPRHAE